MRKCAKIASREIVLINIEGCPSDFIVILDIVQV